MPRGGSKGASSWTPSAGSALESLQPPSFARPLAEPPPRLGETNALASKQCSTHGCAHWRGTSGSCERPPPCAAAMASTSI
eukprot:980406-Prymnesium_polylepis.1